MVPQKYKTKNTEEKNNLNWNLNITPWELCSTTVFGDMSTKNISLIFSKISEVKNYNSRP